MKSQVTWTKEEVDLLKKYGTINTIKELSDMLPMHTTIAISAKRKRLGVKLSDEYISRICKENRSKLNEENLCFIDQHFTINDLNNITLQIILGSVLGDCSIKKNGSKKNLKNFIFSESHKPSHNNYTLWKMSNLQMFLPKTYPKKYIGTDEPMLEMWTLSHPIFTTLRDKYYPARKNSNKCLMPTDMIERMDDLGLLIWYLDDGYNGIRQDGRDKQNNLRRPSPSIAAKSYTYEDLCKTTEILNRNLGLHLYVVTSKHCGGINKIVKIPAIDRDMLFPKWQEIAKTHNIPQCMMYKLCLHKH